MTGTLTQLVHFSNAIGVAHADPREFLPLPTVESGTIPDAT